MNNKARIYFDIVQFKGHELHNFQCQGPSLVESYYHGYIILFVRVSS